jgi:hypothetical protein
MVTGCNVERDPWRTDIQILTVMMDPVRALAPFVKGITCEFAISRANLENGESMVTPIKSVMSFKQSRNHETKFESWMVEKAGSPYTFFDFQMKCFPIGCKSTRQSMTGRKLEKPTNELRKFAL